MSVWNYVSTIIDHEVDLSLGRKYFIHKATRDKNTKYIFKVVPYIEQLVFMNAAVKPKYGIFDTLYVICGANKIDTWI